MRALLEFLGSKHGVREISEACQRQDEADDLIKHHSLSKPTA
jgi:hypothetical protein